MFFSHSRLIYVRNGNFGRGGPITATVPITYVPLDDPLAEEINRRISQDPVYARAGLSLTYNAGNPTTTPSEEPTNTDSTPSNNTTGGSNTEETFITSTAGFAAIAGVVVACLALITCSIIACVYLRVKQRARGQRAKRFVFQHCQ